MTQTFTHSKGLLPPPYIKILTKSFENRGYKWKLAKRNDIETPFNSLNKCTDGALYVCKPKDFFEWITLYPNNAWVSYASIPEDAQKIVLGNMVKASSVVLHGDPIPLADFIPVAINTGAFINNANDYTPLIWACDHGHTDVVKVLLSSCDHIKHGTDVQAYDNLTIRCAAPKGYTEIVKLLIDHGADIHVLNDSPLNSAVYFGHTAIVKLLTNHGANVHALTSEPLRVASRLREGCTTEIAKLLIEQGVKLKSYQNSYQKV
jgi:hypothetical protein